MVWSLGTVVVLKLKSTAARRGPVRNPFSWAAIKMRRAQLARTAPRSRRNHDDPSRADQPCRHHGAASTAGAEHRDGVAMAHLERLDHRSRAGEAPQPSGPSFSSGRSLSIFTAVRCGTRRWVAKLDWPKKCECTAPPCPSRAVGGRAGRRRRGRIAVAMGRTVGEAAQCAARIAAEDRVRSCFEAGDTLAQFVDHSGAFVPEHDRLRRMAAGVLVQVGVADAGGDEADAHLAGCGSSARALDDRRRTTAPATAAVIFMPAFRK